MADGTAKTRELFLEKCSFTPHPFCSPSWMICTRSYVSLRDHMARYPTWPGDLETLTQWPWPTDLVAYWHTDILTLTYWSCRPAKPITSERITYIGHYIAILLLFSPISLRHVINRSLHPPPSLSHTLTHAHTHTHKHADTHRHKHSHTHTNTHRDTYFNLHILRHDAFMHVVCVYLW